MIYIGKPLDLTGQRFGRLLVIEQCDDKVYSNGEHRRRWLCKCDCGNITKVTTLELRSGDTKSCGCYERESKSIRATKHGDSDTHLHNVWRAMRRRCRDSNLWDYEYYGGKGVHVCTEWDNDYMMFKQWSLSNGYRDNLTIDRIDVNKGYEPSNCRWVDMKTQCNNRTSNILYTAFGETHTVSEWSKITGIKYATLYNRLKIRGLNPEIALQHT